jgi:ABC-2 type transport system ATP-binding protein
VSLKSGNGVPAVAVAGLGKVFRDFWGRPKVRALDGLNMEIPQGEVFGLLGPNGSGKSTTIKMLVGLLRPTEGSVRILGRRPDERWVRHRVGYLPEESHLYQYLTARETLDFYGRLFGLPRSERRARTAELLAMSGLEKAADRPVGEYSKGMARRIGIAQALINDPALVVLDEPTSGLDPIGCREMKDLILTLARRGKTVLLSSHLLADVEDVCHRIGILFGGRLQACGRIPDLLEKRDRVRITMPVLSPDSLGRVLEAAREQARCEPEVEHPAMGLEQFFLNVVRSAGGERPARAGGGLPRYLRPEDGGARAEAPR